MSMQIISINYHFMLVIKSPAVVQLLDAEVVAEVEAGVVDVVLDPGAVAGVVDVLQVLVAVVVHVLQVLAAGVVDVVLDPGAVAEHAAAGVVAEPAAAGAVAEPAAESKLMTQQFRIEHFQ